MQETHLHAVVPATEMTTIIDKITAVLRNNTSGETQSASLNLTIQCIKSQIYGSTLCVDSSSICLIIQKTNSLQTVRLSFLAARTKNNENKVESVCLQS